MEIIVFSTVVKLYFDSLFVTGNITGAYGKAYAEP